MQKHMRLIAVLMLLTICSVMQAAAAPVPVTIDRVEIDDIELSPGHPNRLDLQRGQEVEVEVKITAGNNSDDVEIEAFISGFEYNDIESVRDVTHVFDVDANVTYVKRLKLRLSDDMDEDDYKLRIMVTNRYDDAIVQTYNLKMDVPRHGLRLEDVIFFPNGQVKAGQAVLATVRLENKGEKDQSDVRVMVSIPELGVSAVDYIDEIEEGDEEETEEMFIRIPPNAKSGIYDVEISTEFNQRHSRLVAKRSISISGDPSYEKKVSGSNEPDAVVTFGAQLQSVRPGDAALFPLTIKNNLDADRAFTVSVDGASSWANAKVSPATTQIIGNGDSRLFSVYLTPKQDTEPDARVFSVSVKMGDKVIKQVPLTVNVLKDNNGGSSSTTSSTNNTGGLSGAKRVLEVILIVLVALLIIVGLVIGFRKAFGDEEDEENYSSESPGTQTYY